MGRIVLRVRQARLDYQQRLGRNISVQEVATALGITRAALSKVENDETFISRPVLAKLCEYYQLQPGDLLKYEDRRAARIANREAITTRAAEVEVTGMAGTILALHP